MNVFKKILFFISYILIKIGDFMIFLLDKVRIYFNKKQLPSKKERIIIKNLSRRWTPLIEMPFIRKKNASEFFVKKEVFKKKKNHYHRKNTFDSNILLYKLKFFLLGIVFSFLFIFMPLLGLIFTLNLPNPYNLSVNSIPKTTKIYDRNNRLLYEIYANQNRTVVKLQDVPKQLQQATIAIEDKDFYNHLGFDLRGIARALLSNVQNKELQGGSTITQQLVKSAFLSPEPNVTRKVKEIIIAFWAERIYSKNQILELYFNYVPYGGTAWGIESASEIYFDKNVKDLNLAESAFLAGMPKAPSMYSPYINGNKLWEKRQREVLDAMTRQGYISQEQAENAYRQELKFNSPSVPIKAPHFVMYIKDLLVDMYGLSEVERGGLKVKTSLDLNMQEMAEDIVKQEVQNDRYLNIKNGAALITFPSTGDILAMVGNHDYFDSENGGNVNITTSLRQPGSTIKIVTYSLALSNGFTEATIIDDSPVIIQSPGAPPYIPVNYDGKFRGRLPLRIVFANSLNIPAVKVAQKMGVDNIVNFGQELGIKTWNTPKRYGLSITLGAAEVKMLDLATVYGTVANSGLRVNLDPLLEVKNSDGQVIYQKNSQSKQVLDPGVAFIVSDILSDNNARSIEFGTNSPLNIPNHKVSVKTGTSDEKRDNWTIGYTKDLLVASWVGNNDNSPMSQTLASGITGAAPIWNKIMTSLLENKKDNIQNIPANIVKKFCLGHDAYFIKGTENSVSCAASPSATLNPTLTPTP